MIERYTLPEMGQIWSNPQKLQTWLEVELAVCEAQAELGRIPREALEQIKHKAAFDPNRVLQIEAEVKHDVIAFLTNVNEYVGEAGRYIHVGLTSSDVLDTALSLQLVASVAVLQARLADLSAAIRTQAQRHRHTLMIGRTHGIHAEPITFGFKLVGWLAECLRHQGRLERLQTLVAVGKISGAVGTYANVSPQVEQLACARLGLKPDTASTQVISRDRHAEYVQTLALIGSSLERFATEIRNLQRTDVLEVEEYFAPGQKGSSAMPHKRNPIKSEQLTGIARLLRGYALSALENIPLWHERDISHSSVERVILPDASILCHYLLVQMTDLVQHLQVHAGNMERNLNIYGGVIFSQQVLLTLVDKGLSREEAYRLVQENAHRAWNQPHGDFRANLLADARVMAHLSETELSSCFDATRHLAHLDQIFSRLGL
ncbi:adenylosuccinate lyase [Synechococcus sp. Nb3U1]|uniref:adenylosuccinate lyase n=1 Tax=Synechococcus sp. Nb3U1 TaxID=1914529 RepID=UPI001F28A007|nr:adenylosuccinate lyase [Synechococcus sp. Nb3U1]MCF2970689.1 adenylosuccinate lyase [Synechococcus sp. Nb3U1]